MRHPEEEDRRYDDEEDWDEEFTDLRIDEYWLLEEGERKWAVGLVGGFAGYEGLWVYEGARCMTSLSWRGRAKGIGSLYLEGGSSDASASVGGWAAAGFESAASV